VIVNDGNLKQYDYSFCINLYQLLLKNKNDDIYMKHIIDSILQYITCYEYILKYIKNQTKELYIIALELFPISIKYIKNQTDQLVMLAINKSDSAFWVIRNLNKCSINTIMEIYKITIMRDPFMLEYVDDKLEYPRDKMNEIYKIALERDWRMFKYVKFQTYELCLISVKKSPDAISMVKPSQLTPEEYNNLLDIINPYFNARMQDNINWKRNQTYWVK
jgi:hypothetical protein